MSYTAQTFNVMTASPGDVGSERSIIRDVVYEWNAVHSAKRRIVLLPIGWESHSSPEMGAKPQTIINNQVLEKCDLMIGVFWTRIGTATDTFASGTVEEIERHILTKKPVMLYFSSQPVAMDTVDIEQIRKLKEFKDSCRGRGLYESYDNLSDFRSKLYRHLQIKLNDHEIFSFSENEVADQFSTPAVSLPKLSSAASSLLKEASKDDHGTILFIRHLGGADIQTNGKSFIESTSQRDVALWEEALQSLIDSSLVVARGERGEVFSLSNLGYRIADMIEV